jgi:hypothetical protein
MRDQVDRNILVWAINQVGWVDSFTGDPLDVRNAVTFEARPKGTDGPGTLYVVTGETYDKIREVLDAKLDLEDFIDGREL